MGQNVFEVKKQMHEIFKGSRPEPSRSELFEAFRSSDPLKALQRLVRLRRESGVDLDQPNSRFGTIYRTLLGALLDAAGVFEMSAEWLEGGGVLLAAEETGSEDFRRHVNDSKNESCTARAFGLFLAIHINISKKETRKILVGQQLRKNGFFFAIQYYLNSTYFQYSLSFPISFMQFDKIKIRKIKKLNKLDKRTK